MAKRKSGGWVPNQHGAWAMVILPCLAGLAWAGFGGHFRPGLVVLVAAWLVGYFAFFATSQWLKSRRKPRFVTATVTYCTVAAVLAVVMLVLQPGWWTWGLVFGPLTAVAFFLTMTKRERSVVSGASTVLAASLIPMVMGSESLFRLGGMPELFVVSTVCFGYFFGTVLYVKTLIRERGHVSWVVASVVWHLAWVAISILLPGDARWLLAGFFLLASARAFLVPWWGPLRGRNVTAKQAGMGEIVLSIILAVILLYVVT